MTRVFRKSDGSQVMIGASRTASRFRAHTPPVGTSFAFGVDTAAGNAPVDIGIAGITISSGDPSGHFQVADVGGRTMLSLSSAGDAANMSGSPYSLTLSTGATITVTGVANAITVDSTTEAEAILESSGTALGYTIYLREGGSYSSGVTIRPPCYSGGNYAGTWTAPTAGANFYDAPDLDSGNYVRVRAHTGETPLVTARWLIEGNGNSARIRFSGLSWKIVDGDLGTSTFLGMIQLNGADDIAVDNCTFRGESILGGHPVDHRRTGISAVTGTCERLYIFDNRFEDVYEGIRSMVANPDMMVIGNVFQRTVNDGCHLNHSDNVRFCWNLLLDKWRPDADGSHPDMLQVSGPGQTPTKNVWVIGNILVRGAGKPGSACGQGIFIKLESTTTTNSQPVVVGNRVVNSFANGIWIGAQDRASPNKSENAYVRNNTVIKDPTIEQDGQSTITIQTPETGSDRKYNTWMFEFGSATDNIVLTSYAQYDDYYVGGQAGVSDSGIGSTLAEIVANTNIKSGSAADTASPKIGAHQDYVDYVNRTLSLPYSLPTPVA